MIDKWSQMTSSEFYWKNIKEFTGDATCIYQNSEELTTFELIQWFSLEMNKREYALRETSERTDFYKFSKDFPEKIFH